eukprot:Nitzschia sp. Nitz4//scaffold199_size41809//13893//15257//NITZ4_007449-RA/size41809-exonerate_est2genome-gene-0.3-mRNA-1//-1//CDS//3329540558//973//frame0
MISDPSIPILLRERETGRSVGTVWKRRASPTFQATSLLKDPEFVSPHSRAIHSLSIDQTTGRFLLAGSADGTLSIYDQSPWGRASSIEKCHQVFPVAQTIKVRRGPLDDSLTVPRGHSAGITHVQWYPVDSGAFLSLSLDETLLFWDTNQMLPVSRVCPWVSTAPSPGPRWGVAHLGVDPSLVVTGSSHYPSVTLVDLRSGSCSHQLTGHTAGITSVQWCPTSSYILASGSRDGTIRMWDIRQAGSRACLARLTRELRADPLFHQSTCPPVQQDYMHLRTFRRAWEKHNKRRRIAGPNDYRQQEEIASRGSRSHDGPVRSLSFVGGQELVSLGSDGEILAWDLRHGPTIKPCVFVPPPESGRRQTTPGSAALILDSNRMAWIGNQTKVLGYALDRGGSPVNTMGGHLDTITSLACMYPENYLYSGSRDGMILCWGRGREQTMEGRHIVQDRDRW